MRTPEVVNNASFIVIFPLTFIANTFVSVNYLPGPLKTFAEWNPVSSVTQAARELFGNTDPSAAVPDVLAAAEPDALHADLGGPDRRRVRAALDPAVPARRQPMHEPRDIKHELHLR